MNSNLKCKEFERTFKVSRGIVFAIYKCEICGKEYEQMIGETCKPEEELEKCIVER